MAVYPSQPRILNCAGRALGLAAAVLVSQTLLASAAHAVPVIDGGSALIFGNFTSSNNSTDGALIVGGNTVLSGFGVNSSNAKPYGIVSGGTVTLSSSGVTGSVWSAGAVKQTSSGISGSVNSMAPSDVNWGLYRSYFDNLSNTYGSLAKTGTTSLQWGTLNFTATSAAATAVFTVTADQIRNASSMSFAGLAAGQNLVINVLGTSVALANANFSNSLGAYSSILNFVDATSVSFNSLDLNASVLATDAKITGQGGNIKGLVVANEWDAQVAMKYNAQAALKLKSEADMRAALGSQPPHHVPEPGSLALAGLALAGVAMTRRRQLAQRDDQSELGALAV